MDQQIIELYKQSGNGGLVAKQLGITNYKVYTALRRNGIEPKRIGGKEKASLQDLTEAYNSGLSSTQVANKFNMTASSVVERLQGAGVQLRSKKEALILSGHTKITPEREQEVIDLYLSGQSAMQIAKHFGLKVKDQVLETLKKHGIKARDMFGANNHAWKGGKVPLNKLIRNHTKYTNFVKHVIQSRDYTCEVTGVRGGKLNVHHDKVYFSKLVDQFMEQHADIMLDREKLNLAIEEFQPFWNESNVILISEAEHKNIHKTVKDCD